VVGIDIGATWLRAVLADGEGRFLLKKRERTEQSEEALEAQLVQLVRALLSETGVEELDAIGVGAVGPIDIRAGAIVRPPNLPVERVEVARTLYEAFRTPIYVLNDCVAACYGEAFFGAGRGLSDLVFVGIGTGIGGGAIVDGHLLLGQSGNAVEIGHLVVDALGRMRCTCGAYGHWEAYCSGAGMPAFLRTWARERVLKERELEEALGGEPSSITAKDILEACRKEGGGLGDFLNELVRFNAAGLANIINAFNPALISIGGSVALGSFDIFIEPALALLPSYAFNEVPKIVQSPLGQDAGLYGAVALALRPPYALVKRASYAKAG